MAASSWSRWLGVPLVGGFFVAVRGAAEGAAVFGCCPVGAFGCTTGCAGDAPGIVTGGKLKYGTSPGFCAGDCANAIPSGRQPSSARTAEPALVPDDRITCC